MINLQGYFSDFGGCYFYRMAFPYNTIHERMRSKFQVSLGYKLEAATLRQAHVAVFQRVTTNDILMFMKAARRSGIRVIVDIDDDLLNIPVWNPAAGVWGLPEKQVYKDALQTANALFVSTDYLKEQYIQYNPNIAVLPNCVDPYYLRGLKKPNNNKVFVVGYQGSNTHVKDLETVREVISYIRKNPTEYIFKTFGHKHPHSFFTNPVQFESFYSILATMDLDAGLAPLDSHDFNRAKSNIKWMEYSVVGTPTIASLRGPYKCIRPGIDGLIANNTEEWFEHLKALKNNPELGTTLVKNAQARIMTDYNITKTFTSWADNIERVLNDQPVEDHKFKEEQVVNAL
jgi:glycosyltransferase involved in cell wall biosynthesis